MDKTTVLNIIGRYKDALVDQGVVPSKIVLFGSYCRGNAREDSDIDIAVVSEDFDDMDFWDRIKVTGNAVLEVMQPVETVPLTPDEWENSDRLIVLYAREGEVVYDVARELV